MAKRKKRKKSSPAVGSKTPRPDYDPLASVPASSASSLGTLDTGEGGSDGREAVKLGHQHGVPGIKHWFGRLYEEWLPELDGEKGRRAYAEMAWNEPTIFSFRYAIEMLIRETRFEIEPHADDPDGAEWAAFVDSCYHDMEQPMSAMLSDALSMTIYGWALQEMSFKLRRGDAGEQKSNHDDGRIGWAAMAPRHQETLDRWELDNQGRVLGFVQWAPPAYQYTRIPAEVLLHYKTHEWHASPEGVSMLRGAYVPFCFKKSLQVIEAIGIERDLAGIPVARIPAERMRLAGEASLEGVAAAAEVAAIQKLVRDIKVDEQMGIVFPRELDEAGRELYDISLMSAAGGKAVNTNEVIRRYKEEMYGAVLADFLAFGHETTGTQALGTTRMELFIGAVNALITSITGPHNRVAIPLLCRLNGKTSQFPTIGFSDLKEANLAALTPFLQALGGLGVDLNDEQTERHLRRLADLPVPEIEGAGQ